MFVSGVHACLQRRRSIEHTYCRIATLRDPLDSGFGVMSRMRNNNSQHRDPSVTQHMWRTDCETPRRGHPKNSMRREWKFQSNANVKKLNPPHKLDCAA